MADDIVTRLRKEISKRDRPYPVELLPELREAAVEIERLRAEVREYHKIRADYCAAWSKWIDDHGGLDVAEWCRVYADAVPHPNPDGPEVVHLIHSRLDARFREAADEIELLRFERDNLARNADECRETLTELRQRVETLTAERDEANANAKLYRDERDQAQRALLILLTGNDISMMHRHANERGWDCFKGEADAR